MKLKLRKFQLIENLIQIEDETIITKIEEI